MDELLARLNNLLTTSLKKYTAFEWQELVREDERVRRYLHRFLQLQVALWLLQEDRVYVLIFLTNHCLKHTVVRLGGVPINRSTLATCRYLRYQLRKAGLTHEN